MKLLDDYITSTGILCVEDKQYDDAIKVIFQNAVKSIAKVVIERKNELPNEDVLFVLTCKTYKLKEYMEAHPNVFNDIQVILKVRGNNDENNNT